MKLTEKNAIVYLMLSALIIILIPFLIRLLFYNNIMIGEESYYHANIARQIIEQKSLIHDSDYIFNPYHLVLASAGYFIGVELASKLIPFLLGLLSVLIFYLILKGFKIKIKERFFMLLILIISPAFIYLSVISNTHSVPVFLTLLGVYFLLKKNTIFKFLSLIAFALAASFGLFNALLVISILLAYMIKKKSKAYIIPLLVIIFISAAFMPAYFQNKTDVLPKENILQNNLSDLGALIGVGVFNILLAFTGFFLMWKKKEKYIFTILLFFAMLLSLFYTDYAGLYLNFVLAVLAGYSFVAITAMKWEVKSIKNLTILFIICGLAFSTISYLNRVSNMQPDNEIIKSLEWLKHYSEPDEIVFSHYSKGFWINAIAEKPVMIDSMFEYYPGAKEKFNDSLEIFYSRNLKNTRIFLNKYNLNYIWIDNEMKNGLVWEKEQQGLLFLFRNNETFNNIYNNQGIEIWEVKNGYN